MGCDMNTPFLDANLEQDCVTVVDKWFGIHGASYSSHNEKQEILEFAFAYFDCSDIPSCLKTSKRWQRVLTLLLQNSYSWCNTRLRSPDRVGRRRRRSASNKSCE